MFPASKIHNLRVRAEKLSEVRTFFKKKGVMEVDCMALHSHPTIDGNIDPVEVYPSANQKSYLHTSPEYKMKRLLCHGIGDIYQLGHVFRKGELSNRHNPEFTMIEWYRISLEFGELLKESIELIELFIGPKSVDRYSFYEALSLFGNISEISKEELIHALKRENHSFDPSWSLESLLDLTWSEVIEKKFNKNHLTLIVGFPPFAAALAKVDEKEIPPIALRAELYFGGYELGNGYDELQDPQEYITRFTKYNKLRAFEGKETYEIDPDLIEALEIGLPACTGMAIGFDRLMMLHLGTNNIYDVIF